MAIDTLKIAKRLREAGFTDPQAEAVVAAVQEGAEGAEVATKADLGELRAELKAEIAELRFELRQTELRLEARIEAVRSELKAEIAALKAEIATLKADILSRVFALILGALVVNIVAMIGAVFAVAKLLGH
jgi:DNA-binding transcriptional MerR regulator